MILFRAGQQLALTALSIGASSPRMSTALMRVLPIDFTEPTVAPEWMAVDDRIMGGASQSRVVFADGATSFEGNLIVEGGGFASVRFGPALELGARDEVLVLEASSDGRLGYKVTLTSAVASPGVSYQFTLPQLDDEPERLSLPLEQFKPSFRGQAAPDAPPLRATDVRGLGLMLSRYEGGGGEGKQSIEPGAFRLRLHRLEAEESALARNSRRWAQKK